MTVLTYQDAVEHLARYMGGAAQDTQQSAVRGAVLAAYDELVNERSWQYLYTEGAEQLVGEYQEGTIEFDLTGGSSERLVTFSTALPTDVRTWAGYGRLIVADIVYEVDEYLGTTTVSLKTGKCPTADLPAGTPFILFRSNYPLPENVRRVCDPHQDQQWYMYYISPKEWHFSEHRLRYTGPSFRWTMMADPDRMGQWSILVDGYPTEAARLDYVYQRWARPIRYSGQEQSSRAGTIANTGAAVTGTSTTFTSAMAGSYLRIGTTTDNPTGLGGLDPFVEQVQIKSVTNATSLTLVSAPSTNYSGVKYCITDPLDLPRSMHNAMKRCCEWQYAIVGRVQDVDRTYGYYQQARNLAFESDSVAEIDRVMGSAPKWYNRWRNPPTDPV